MSEVNKKSKAEINAEAVATMKGQFAELLTAAEMKDGEVKINGAEVFERNLPEELTMKHVKALQQHVSNTTTAAHGAIGDLAIDAMAADGELPRVVGHVALGVIGKTASYVSRCHEGRNPSTGEAILTKGVNNMTVDIFAPGGQAFNATRDLIKSLAADKL